MRSSKPALSLAALALVALAPLVPSTASASSNYPGEIQKKVGASDTPPCTICHDSLQGGLGTVTQPFGQHMMERGLVASDVASLDTALQAIEGEKSDTDGDGVTDYDELVAGTDPNAAGDDSVVPKYGCNNVSGQAPSAGAWLLALGAVLALRRLTRR